MKHAWLSGCLMMLLIVPGYAEDEDDELYEDVKPEQCLSVRRIKKTEILDDRTIFFYMSGNKIYRNHLPRKCFGLKRSDSFSYKLHTSRLCAIDSIKVVDRIGGDIRSGASCGLGKFYPISEEEVAFLKGDEPRPEEPEAPDEDE